MRTFLYSVIMFASGALLGAYGNQSHMTWGDLIKVMPVEVKRIIAIDYCVANRGLCKTLPMSSPIEPMDGRVPG